MDESVRTITLDKVELQENGIIRLPDGRLIARLIDSVNFKQLSTYMKVRKDDSESTRKLVKEIRRLHELKLSKPVPIFTEDGEPAGFLPVGELGEKFLELERLVNNA